MKISKTVLVGAHEIEVVFKSEETDGYTKWGSNHLMRNKFFISKDCAPSKQEVSLFHEFYHEISSQHGLELSESTVETLSETTYEFLKRNNFLK